MSKKSKLLYNSSLLILVLINLSLLSLLLFSMIPHLYGLHFSHLSLNQNKPTEFIIQKNESLKSVSQQLKKQKLIHDPSIFLKWVERLNLDRKIQAGKFYFNDSLSLWKLIHKLTKSMQFYENITIFEGLTIEQTASIFEKAGLNKKKFIDLCHDQSLINSLNIKAQNLEGYLFPDTYQVNYGLSEKKAIEMMIGRFKAMIKDCDIENSLIYKTSGLNKGLIIASLIEKETRYHPEKNKISSVFWNRINNNWRLDSDVTVRYALKKWKDPLTKKDLKTPSPYNTRKYKGFPPGPICNPGKESLKSAFYPSQTDYFFFIATGSSKGHSIFTKTLKKHNVYKKKIMKNQ